MTRLSALLLASLLCACPSADPGDEPAPATGLPDGVSTWEGTASVGGFDFSLEVELDNSAGDLQAVVAFDDDDNGSGFGRGVFTATGVHEPGSGLLAFSPDDWEEEPNFQSELLGLLGTYDPESRTISGSVRDYASPTDNSLAGGPFEASFVSGDGEATAPGEPTHSLATGSQTFLGTMQCSGGARDVEATLSYDGAGGIEGSVHVGDPTLDSSLGAFDVLGVHNPTTGGLILVPDLWEDGLAHNIITFFIDGSFDSADGSFDGDQGTNTNACLADQWMTELQD